MNHNLLNQKTQPISQAKTRIEYSISATFCALALLTSGVRVSAAPDVKPKAAPTTRVYATDLTDVVAASNGGRVVESTSTFNDDKSYSAANLIGGKAYNPNDKNSPNGWVSNKYDSINMESVTFGFADNAQKNIGKIVINPSAAVTPERWAKDIEVQVSTQNAQGPFRAVAQISLKRSPARQEFLLLPAAARFVKMVVRSNWGSDRAVALGTVEMYESIPTDDPAGEVITRLEGAINDLKKFKDAQTQIANATGGAAITTSTTDTTKLNTQISAQVVPLLDPALTRPVADTTSSTGSAAATSPASPTAASQLTNGRATNIAAASNGGKIVDVSSVFNNDPRYGAGNLIDGQNSAGADDKGSAGWASEGFTPGQQYVTIGFRDDRTHVISKLVLNPVSNQNPLRWASRVEVQVTNGSPKDGPFRTVSTLTLRQRAENQDFTLSSVEAKYVRFVFVANGPGNPLPQGDPNVSSDRAVSLGEIEIYEPAASSGELDSLVDRFSQVLLDLKTLRAQQKLAPDSETSTDVTSTDAPTDMETAAPASDAPVTDGAPVANGADSGAPIAN